MDIVIPISAIGTAFITVMIWLGKRIYDRVDDLSEKKQSKNECEKIHNKTDDKFIKLFETVGRIEKGISRIEGHLGIGVDSE